LGSRLIVAWLLPEKRTWSILGMMDSFVNKGVKQF
jgi:hypothetical protein